MPRVHAPPPLAPWLAGCALALLLAACASPPAASPGGQADALAQVGRWTLQGARDPTGASMTVLAPGGAPVHALAFDGTRVTVLGGCNHIGGRYRIEADGTLVVDALQSTLMACQDTARMDADAALAALLEGRARWRIAESWPEQLSLDHADGSSSHWVADRTH